jgi:3-methyladenine DNA glycosylase AlkC
MAEPLKNHFGTDVPALLAASICAVHPKFPAKAFAKDALTGFDALELTGRGRHLAAALHRHLPANYPQAVDILVRSSALPPKRKVASGMTGFFYMPHCFFVAEHGLGHLAESFAAQHALTQKFTCEFSIRPFLIHHPQATLAQLRQWAHDPSEHVRRLVSEGTRPRLPWAMRLPAFQADPRPVLELLDLLKDDAALYVRRSVANNLNDIGKDNPHVLIDVAQRWLVHASPEREWVVRHALRWAIKQGDAGALKALGFGKAVALDLRNPVVSPGKAVIGGAVTIAFDLHNPTAKAQDWMVDLAVHYVKANGASRAKVFKLKAVTVAPSATENLRKTVSLREMTTRKHFAGVHRVEAVVNGVAHAVGGFQLGH